MPSTEKLVGQFDFYKNQYPPDSPSWIPANSTFPATIVRGQTEKKLKKESERTVVGSAIVARQIKLP